MWKINHLVLTMTIADVMSWAGWGMLLPILSVYYTEEINGGSLALAGMASTVYLLSRSALQIPTARFIDRRKGEKDDFYILMLGSSMISLSAFLYIFVSQPWHVLAVQSFYGIGGALSYPAWLSIFTRHVDKDKVGMEWGLYSTTTDISMALTGAAGGIMAEMWGYKIVFIIAGFLTMAGTLYLSRTARELIH